MKRAVKLIVVLFILLLLFQFIILLFKNTHNIEYTITTDKNKFAITESFDNNKYYFDISLDDYNFYFSSNNYFNKQKKIIENIEYVKNQNMLCIYPVYKNDISGEIICSDSKLMYSYTAASNNESVVKFKQYIYDKYKLPVVDGSKYEYMSSIKYYTDVYDNESIMLWGYQGVYNIRKNGYKYQKVLDFDRYENTLSRVVQNYYVTPIYTSNSLFEIQSFLVINLTNNKTFNIELKDFSLSNYTYVLGIVDNKLYLFDKSNILEVEIDINKKVANVIATSKNKAKFYNGEWIDKSMYELVKSESTFTYSDISMFSEYESVLEDDNAYYLYDGSNMYKVYKKRIESKILLFSMSNVKDITVKNSSLYFINGKILYKYNLELYKMMEYSEFEYNSYRLYDVY